VLHHLFSKNLFLYGRDFSFFFRFGQEAVILFFFLSGFVIQYAYLKGKDQSIAGFLLKRFLRVYIPLFAVFGANFLLLRLQNATNSFSWKVFFGNLFMLQDVGSLKPNVICEPFLGNTPLWSLSYEWWFYIFFIFCTTYLKVNLSKTVYIIGTLSTISYIFYPNFINRELMYLIIWWIGTDMAKLYLDRNSITLPSLRLPLGVLLLNIVLLAINIQVHKKVHTTIGVSPILEFRHFVFALLSIFIAILWKNIGWVGFDKTIGLFEFIAPISFGIYISHYFLIINAHYLDLLISNYFVRIIVYTLCCCLFAYFIERIIYVKMNKFIVLRRAKK
jgi:peptidoglycan/LPS O-acetylase OafA/YrhL